MADDEKALVETQAAIADESMLTSKDLTAIADKAEKNIQAVKRIIAAALKVTNDSDWTDYGGKPYMEVSGAQKIASLFNVSWQPETPTVEFHDDGHYTWTYTGDFSLGRRVTGAVGTRSSRDDFFAVAHEKDVPISEIDAGAVKKAAWTNWLNRGIKAILGLNNLTWDQLKEAGMSEERIGKVRFRKGSLDPNAPMTLPNYGDHANKPLSDPSVSLDWLQRYLAGAETRVADEKFAKYKARNEQLRDAIKAELKRRQDALTAPSPPVDAAAPMQQGQDAAASKAKKQKPANVEPASAPKTVEVYKALLSGAKSKDLVHDLMNTITRDKEWDDMSTMDRGEVLSHKDDCLRKLTPYLSG